MAIYRGPGGAGDATGDATNASALALAARDEAQASATSAASSATAAANSATAADTSATSAATSATNAAGSATTASTAATNAANSASDASDSADAAAASASDAADSATAAASSATSASTDASTASTQASNAASSASSASTSASTATTKASEAATSATNAASSASTASTAATNASNSASAAATSETNAASSASSASTSASTATTKASEASSSASSASTSASTATTQASNAASSASAASTSASNASTSATNAASSATSAATSASEAAASAVTAATFDPALYLTKANPSFTGTLAGTGDIRLNNGTADGAQLQLASSGYSDWNIDNYSGSLRAYYGSTSYLTLSNTGTLTVPTLAVTNTVTTANNLGLNPYGNGFKNRIINGAMMIDQRNAGASVTPTDGQYTLDRWLANASQASKFTVQQTPSATETGYATRVGAGFTSYLAVTSSAATSVGASDYFDIRQVVEGFNISDLAWGTANASPVTLSFWVRSSLTGTFGGSLVNGVPNLSYPFSYSISAANTWEQKTITITGPTTGTWNTNNTGGIRINFGLGVGSTLSGTAGAWVSGNLFSATGATSVVGTSGATFYITGVQLEKGSTATSFDYRPYGTELALCQRYYTSSSAIPAYMNGSGTVAVFGFHLPSAFRTTPSISYTGTVNMVVPGVVTYSSTTQPSSISTPNVQNNQVVFSIGGFGTTIASGAGSLGATAINFSAEL